MYSYTPTSEIKKKIEAFSDDTKGFAVAEVLMALVDRIELLERKLKEQAK